MIRLLLLTLLLVFVLLPCTSYALPIPDDGNSVISGRTVFTTGTDYLPQQISAHVDYEVLNYPGREVGGNYLYTYRIVSEDSTEPLTFFSVGVRDGAQPHSPAYDAALGDVLPMFQLLAGSPPRSVDFLFYSQTINAGNQSALLYFVSDYAPSMGRGTLGGGGICDVGALPTPVPEPAVLSLFGAAAAVGFVRRLRKRPP